MKNTIFILLVVIMSQAVCHKKAVDAPTKVINSSQIIKDLTDTYPFGPTRYPLLMGVLSHRKRFIAIISGPSEVGYSRQGAKGALIFNQSLEDMIPGGDVLLPGAGRPLEDVFPELVAKVYPNSPFEFWPEALSMMCGHPGYCMLFAKTGPHEMTIFDLFDPQRAPCVVPQLWDRLSKLPPWQVPLPYDQSQVSYFSYQRTWKGSTPESRFTGSLAFTFPEAITYTGPNLCIAELNQTTDPVRYLCHQNNETEFAYQKKICRGNLFDYPIAAGFVYKEHFYLMPSFDQDVIILPMAGFEEGNPDVTYPLMKVSRVAFWHDSSYFL